ncbi:restriction endonuclease subunit S [Methanosphaera stadtmanae]|nr:restriction endonuclease subunit S [Methanosphaera stadtmanae]
MQGNKNIPELRFPEFEGEWKKITLNNLAKIQRGASPRPISSNRWYDNENKKVGWVRIGDVTNSSRYLYRTEDYFSEEGIKKSRFLPKGSLIMSICATIGKPIITEIDTCIHDGFVGFSDLTNINKEFLYYILKNLENKFISLSQTGSQANLNTNLINKTKINMPSIKEQKKIANFLTCIDQKIELMEKKHTLYQSIKKYILSNIFPVNNKKPSLRFKEFKNERKLIKLKEILSYSSSKHSLNKLEDNIGNYELYGAEGVVKHVNFFDMDKEYISIIKDGAGVCRLHLCKPYSSIVGTMGYLTLKNTNYNLKYVYYQLLTLNLKKYVIGTTIPHIYFKDYSKEYILVPNLIEQGKMANLMLLLDTKIMKIQKQIDNLKKFKKGLLQKMFC